MSYSSINVFGSVLVMLLLVVGRRTSNIAANRSSATKTSVPNSSAYHKEPESLSATQNAQVCSVCCGRHHNGTETPLARTMCFEALIARPWM